MRTARQVGYEVAAAERAKTDPHVLLWRERGGYEGALARHAARGASSTTKAATGHMPFPGHRHMGEIG